MRTLIALGAAGVALMAATAAAAAPSVEIEHAAARVVVIPEDRSDVKVEVTKHHPKLAIKIERHGDKVTVDGGLGGVNFGIIKVDVNSDGIRNCRVRNGKGSVEIRGVGDVALEDLPQIVIRTPRRAEVAAGGAVFGDVGRSEELTLSNSGCGDWTVANVRGELKLRQAGSGDVRAGQAGSLDIKVAGSGDIATQAVSRNVSVSVAGSGNVQVASLSGDLDVKVAGSGDVTVLGGRARDINVSIAGSGNVDFAGTADSLRAKIAGSGDVRALRVTGEVSKSVVGSGDVRVGS
ncbi:GIN domain-containing protein [Caulobacter sp. NIBR2454]|uniref:GIN domain-containing protein n=1 Tax=Caulobacter sp. NIBR2454 TaxID=3015996 RepID=UPI0022B6B25C|nr:DUF2807 domain-containing protein [Caulobacter sp. NIBR2454]